MLKEITINKNGSTLFYRLKGEGTAVMLVHGFGEDGQIWENQYLALQDRFRMIVPDLPGSGRSSMKDELSMDLMAVQLKELLDELKVDTCYMIGHSMGGYVTLAFAEQFPERLKGLGLFHSTAFADSEEKKAVRRRGIDFIETHGALKFQEQAIPNLFSDIFKQENPDKLPEFIEKYTNVQGEALVSYYEAMIKRPDRTHILKNFNKPLLFIMGEKDTAVPLEHSLRQCHLPRLSYIQILRHSAHMGMLEEAKVSTGFIRKFLKECEID